MRAALLRLGLPAPRVGATRTGGEGVPAGPTGYRMSASVAVPLLRPAHVNVCRSAQRLLCLLALTAPVSAQEHSLPFKVGEALNYQVRIARMGDVGTGRMWIEGPVVEQGVPTWRIRSEIDAGKGPIHASDRTSSWLDPLRMAILRFEKQERHILSRSDEHVTVDRASHRWTDADGGSGVLGSALPLDELSFIYFLRTLPLERDTVIRVDRHFDATRNPTIVRIAGRDTIRTPAGIFRTRIIEMEVRDPKRYKGTGTIRIFLDEAACHVPVRIESRMPVLGITTLTLTGWSHSPRYPSALPCE